MPIIGFPGGAVAGQKVYYLSSSNYLKQNNVFFPVIDGDSPSDVRRNLDNNYVVRIHSINPDGVDLEDTYPVLTYRGNTYYTGSILTFSQLTVPYNFCEIRVVSLDTFSYFGLGAFGQPGVQEWDPYYTFFPIRTYSTALAGSWSWNTVPTAPSVSAALNGTSVTVTRGSSTTTSEGPITSYRIQRRESTDGATWGSWGNTDFISSLTYTYTGLTPGKYYQFRVYAVNNAGNSEAGISGLILIPSITRYTGTAFIAPDKLKRYNGSAWQNITQAKRWNGTSWVTIDITGVNSELSIGF